MVIVKVVDEDVENKVDTQYVAKRLADLPNVGIIFICTSEGGEEDDWIDEYGMRQIVIHLPYKVVKQSSDVRPLMLARAKERLGLAAGTSLN